jgi:hypothetical protein
VDLLVGCLLLWVADAERCAPLPSGEARSGVKEIPLHGKIAAGRTALVDDEDYDLVMQYRWRAYETYSKRRGTSGPYAASTVRVTGDPKRRQKQVFMHRLLTGYALTDHRNNNGLDNQRHNLRPATTAQNNHNQRPRRGTSSRFKGVTLRKQSGKWQASIKVNGKYRYLGLHASEEDAALAYNAAALMLYGEFAYLNEVAAA